MKKLLALALAVMLVMAMSVNAMAAGLGTENGEVKVDITNGNVSDSTSSKVYHVVITWGDLDFKYSFTGFTNLEKKWDPASHSYVIHGTDASGNSVVATGEWLGATTRTVTVTNHSNNGVKITAKFNGSDSVTNEGITATLAENVFTLANAEGTSYANAPEDTFKVSISGMPNTTNATDFQVGIINVKIEAN